MMLLFVEKVCGCHSTGSTSDNRYFHSPTSMLCKLNQRPRDLHRLKVHHSKLFLMVKSYSKKFHKKVWSSLKIPLICAGGVGDEQTFIKMLALGYSGGQMGTAFIATEECAAPPDYKQAIVQAKESDIVVTERFSGNACSIIRTLIVEKMGTEASFLEKKLLKNRNTKNVMRAFYGRQYAWKLKRATLEGVNDKQLYQAGKSVGGSHSIVPAGSLVQRFAAALAETSNT
ncbi:nitronate monooxygenase [Deltaproteobacteria bacterium TL4]